MENTALKQPAMVSRLPKFGSRAPPSSSLPNGSALPVSCGGSKGSPVGKQNGVIRLPPSLSFKGKKGREDAGEKVPDTGEDIRGPLRSQLQHPAPRSTAPGREIRKPSATLVGMTARTAAGSAPRPPPQSSRVNPRTTAPKPSSPGPPLGATKPSSPGPPLGATKPSSPGPPLGATKPSSPGPPLGATKAATNGVSPSSGRVKPGTTTSPPLLAQSNDGLRSLPLETVVRSRSFSYLKSPTCSAVPALTRSFSFNRAAELAKELPRPLAQSPLARSPVTHPSLVLAGEKPGDFGFAKPALAQSSGFPFPPTTLKKSLLPSCSGSKSSALSYRLMRPSLIKQPRPLLAGKVQLKAELTHRDASFQAAVPSTSEPSSNTESVGTTPEEPSGRDTDGGRGPTLEIPEDMSLSSTSSLERNDISEEYMDDFDDLGNGGGTLLLTARGRGQAGFCEDDNAIVSQYQEGSSITSLHSFLSEAVDWAEMGLTGSRETVGRSPGCASEGLSVSGDAPHGSSLDLSPSDSSGGTYMWDEEVLEPLEAVPHGGGSYDSELNSMDILNNLENLESCDLEDDDLMLDADLPEDASLHSDVDGMCHYEHSERGYWPSPWRRRQQYWGRQDKLHDDNRGGVRRAGDDRHAYAGSRDCGQATVDELMLKHMTQDCSYVKEQLLQLRSLLQTEEEEGAVEDVGESTASPSSEDSGCQQQVEELLKEVHNLREELMGKDRLITQLTQQMSSPMCLLGQSTPMDVTPCQCPQGEPQAQERQDKATQTPWRVQTATPLTPFLSPRRLQQGSPQLFAPLHHHQRVEELVHYFRDTACLRYYSLPHALPADIGKWKRYQERSVSRPPVTVRMPCLVTVP